MQAKKWQKKRRKDRKAQEAYYEEHPFCEVCLAEGRGRRPTDEVHEIVYRSQGGRCVPENEISTCRQDHDRTHFLREPYLHRDELFQIKKKVEKLNVFQGE